MTNSCIRGTGLPVFILSLMAGLLVISALGLTNTARAETLQSVSFRVPLNVSNIHQDIKFLAPMCRVFTGDVASNANQMGAVRPDIAVPASRNVSQKVTMTISKANLAPGKSLDDATLYSCMLYVKKSANGPLLSYTLSSQDAATRAIGNRPRNVVTGVVQAGREKALMINTSPLSAKGTYGLSSKPLAGVAAPVTVTAPQRIGGVSRVDSTTQAPRSGVGRNGAEAAGRTVGIAVDRRVQGPEPIVTGWSPQNIAHPGQVLVIEGRDFKPNSFVLQLQGEGNRSINLKIKNATASRIEAEITDFDYTGYEGARLVAFQQGGKQKTLDEDYKIVNEDLNLRGDSLWRVGENPADYIFTNGEVNLTLNRFEFRESGRGTLREKVALFTFKNTETESCRRRGVEGDRERHITNYEYKNRDEEYRVTWRKLTDGRVKIEGLSTSGAFSATGRFNGDIFNLEYLIRIPNIHSYAITGECHRVRDHKEFVTQQVQDYNRNPPADNRLVEWALLRTTP